jgi:DNA-binding GntR family transcriptional regulator
MPAPTRAVDPAALIAADAAPADASATPAALSDDDIHARLIEAIVDQRLLPGTKLIEDKLGQAFGVSRTRIRQVLIRLAQEQVVLLQPNKGASVAQPSVAESREVFEARRVIEAVLVQHFATQATTADLQALADCIEAEEQARLVGDKAMALRQSGRFHLLLADAAAHRTFSTFLRKLVSRTSLILMSYGPEPGAQDAAQQLLTAATASSPKPQRWVQACRCDEHRGLLTALKAAVKARGGKGGKGGKARSSTALTDAAQQATAHAVALMTEHLQHVEAALRLDDAPQA